MKKFVLAVAIMALGASARAQSISLLNLTNLTSFSNRQAADDLAARKIFKFDSGEMVDGYMEESYISTVLNNKMEKIIVGKGHKLATGAVLHTVSYYSADRKNVVNLMNQYKSIGVKPTFRGADASDNIYIFDSYLYRMTVRISLDKTRSILDVSQKQAFIRVE